MIFNLCIYLHIESLDQTSTKKKATSGQEKEVPQNMIDDDYGHESDIDLDNRESKTAESDDNKDSDGNVIDGGETDTRYCKIDNHRDVDDTTGPDNNDNGDDNDDDDDDIPLSKFLQQTKGNKIIENY